MSQASPSGLLHSAPLISLLDKAQVDRTSPIGVTGPSGLSALLWLCRHGFEQVGYLKPGCTQEHPDALLVAHTCDVEALDRLLVHGPYVREGGVLIFQSPLPLDRADAGTDPVHRLLERRGYTVERCLRGGHRELTVARRRRRIWAQAA
ncbi:hypothetical protein [Phenylobacterium aquaticum]|uniref:hypothetical protein n=1 Tax=Phenylobacterium aquaticum TaxID=1763816 RepID=UPI0026EB4348|nr:hypothetical protein [Phenylobacterium aquaticum]